MKYSFFIFFQFSFTVLCAQQDVDVLLQGKPVEEISFHIYDPFIARPIYKNLNEVENRYPEQLMSSILSATNQKWVDYNTLGDSLESEKLDVKVFDFRKSMDADKNYFELISKLTFKANGTDMALIKFYLHSEQLPVAFSGVQVMQKRNGRWYDTSTSFTSSMALMLMRFDSNQLYKVLIGEMTGIPLMDNLIKEIKTESGVDINLLVKKFDSWYVNKDEEKLDYFIDKNAW